MRITSREKCLSSSRGHTAFTPSSPEEMTLCGFDAMTSICFTHCCLGSRGLVRQHLRLFPSDPSAGNRGVSVFKLMESLDLLFSCHHPENPPSPVDDRIGKSHPLPALIHACYRNIPVRNVEHSISRHERCCMAVRAEAQMHEIQHGRCSANELESVGVAPSCAFEVSILYWHGVDLICRQGHTLQQALAQVREVSNRIISGRDAFVNLNNMHAFPCEV